MEIQVSKLIPHPLNSQIYRLTQLEDLIYSIGEVGLLQPIVINKVNQILSGHRRFEAIKKLGWEYGDDVSVEIAGSSVYEIDGAGTKWAPKKGSVKYNKDAFIVIKNRDRNPTVPSQPNPDLKAHHA